MKRSTKSSLISALILFTLGVLLTTVSYVVALCNKIDIYNDEKNAYDFVTRQYQLTDALLASGASENAEINELSLQLQGANVQVQKTDGVTTIELHNVNQENYSFQFSAGTLSISEKNSVNIFGFNVGHSEISFGGLRHLFHDASTRPLPEIIIHLNANDNFSCLRSEITCGSFTAVDIPDDIALHTSLTVGEIFIQNCQGEQCALNLTANVGKIEIDNCHYNDTSCNITCGEVSISDPTGNLNVGTVVGSISLTYKNNDTTRLHVNTTFGTIYDTNGNAVGIQLNQEAKQEELFAQLTSTVGNIHLREIY